MYKGFNLSLKNDFFGQSYQTIGEQLYATNQIAIKKALDSFLGATGKIDAGKLQEHWFPQIEADVFISHSHKDRDAAMRLAGWLSESFGLKPFIDSCVWGYANDLLREIDNKYCILNIDKNGTVTYYHDRCIGTSAHVHMMLAAALHTMIDSTECLLFLNTPNAISSEEAASTTASPWIYMEIMMTSFIRRELKRMRRVAEGTRKFALKLKIEPEFAYQVQLGHLIPIDHAKLKEWLDAYYLCNTKYHPLDYLYMLTGGA
jgi:hypothetical protein